MTPERWRQVTEVFHGALAREAVQQKAFLDERCAGDPGLRAEVDAMLAAHRDAGQFGERPVFVASSAGPGSSAGASAAEGDSSSLPTRAQPRSRPQASVLLPGTLLGGRYRIVALQGRGGMGEVYRADDLKLGQAVALKLLPPGLREDETRRQRLRDEVKLARLVAHPNVCRVWDVVETDGYEFLAMEYVDGEDLASLLRRIGRLPEDRAVRMARELCAGLSAVHDQGLLHRDLKPANVMVDGRGHARLADFGLAAVAEQVTGPDIRSGTPAYMSPEQREGREVTVRSDVFALGLVLYEVFTGQQALPEEHLTPSSKVRDLDPAIDRAIERCLEPDPALRPSSAAAVAASLPGGDPLAAALAVGETPSPELVAAAGGSGGIRPPIAWACLATVAVGLPLIAWVGERVSPFYLDLDKPVEVLTYEAQHLIADFAPLPPPVDHAHGFVLEGEATLRQQLLFWYRQSPRSLREDMRLGGTTFAIPPPTVPGMASVRLDAHGLLVEYVRVPARDDAPSGAAPDWSAVLRRAGLEKPRPAAPAAIPPVFGDERFAWDFDGPGVAIRAEAATFRGRPVWFRAETRSFQEKSSWGSATSVGEPFGFFILALLLAAILLARRNLRLGRADREGARRIALFTTVSMVSWTLLRMSRIDFPGVRVLAFAATFTAVACWALYLALEPLVRRSWPDALVSWTRLLRGRVVDPLVGRDALIGVLAGMAVTLVAQGGRMAGNPAAARWPAWPGLLTGGPSALSWAMQNLGSALGEGLFILLLLALLRRLLRSSAAALAAALGLVIVPQFLGSPTELLTHLVIRCVLWGLLLRPGLLAGVVAEVVRLSLGLALMTTHLDAWYADSAIAGILVTLALAAWGFYASLGGRPLLGEAREPAA
jgi:serine/threonine-protein kinase